NSSSCSFTVTVVDTTPPAIICSSNLVLECTGSGEATATFSVSASDTADPNPIIACAPTNGSSFPLGQSTVKCTASDFYTNSSFCSFSLTVLDTTAPVLICPSNIVAESSIDGDGARVSYLATALDSCDASPVVSCVPESGSAFPIGTNTVE